MINEAMVGRMFSACRRAFPVACRKVRYKGIEFDAIKVDESSEAKASMWGVFPDYDCTVIVKLKKARQITEDDSGEDAWLVGAIEVERRIGEVEALSDCYVKLGLEA